MPKILIWDEELIQSDVRDRCVETLKQIQVENYRGAGLKKLRDHRLWSARVNDADRLLLTTHILNGELCWLLVAYVKNHDYQKAAFLNDRVFKTFLESQQTALDNITEDDFNSESTPAMPTPIEEDNQFQKVNHYKGEFISWSDAQQTIFKQPLPLIISGMPGAGKTCIGFILLTNYLKNHGRHAGKILYVTKSASLLARTRQMWLTSPEPVTNSTANIDFLTYADLAQLDPSIQHLTRVGEEHFKEWLKGVDEQFNATTLYQEFRFISISDSLDDYLSQGARSSLFNDNDKKVQAYKLYQNYCAYLAEKKQIDLFFYTCKLAAEYDFVFVDETQDFSPIQLSAILKTAKHQQICFAIDTNQSVQEEVSNRPYLLQLLAKESKQKPTHCHLLQSFRNPPRVIDLANAVLRIKNAMMGGVADQYEYVEVQAHTASQEDGSVEWHATPAKELLALANRTDCAIVVLTEADRIKAAELLNTDLVFTASEIKGLEFSEIILWHPFEDPLFAEVNNLIPEDLAERTLKIHRTKDKNDKSSSKYSTILNSFYTGITRSSGSVHIIATEKHQHRHIIRFLKAATTKVAEKSATKVNKPESTIDEWESKAQELQEQGLHRHAEAIRKRKVKMKPVASSSSSSSSSDDNNSEKRLIDGFIQIPTVEKLTQLLQAKNATQLMYILKGSQNKTICESIRADVLFYLPVLMQADNSQACMKIIFSDPKVFSNWKLNKNAFYTDKIFGLCLNPANEFSFITSLLLARPDLIKALQEKNHAKYFWSKVNDICETIAGGVFLAFVVKNNFNLLTILPENILANSNVLHCLSYKYDGCQALYTIMLRLMTAGMGHVLKNINPKQLFSIPDPVHPIDADKPHKTAFHNFIVHQEDNILAALIDYNPELFKALTVDMLYIDSGRDENANITLLMGLITLCYRNKQDPDNGRIFKNLLALNPSLMTKLSAKEFYRLNRSELSCFAALLILDFDLLHRWFITCPQLAAQIPPDNLFTLVHAFSQGRTELASISIFMWLATNSEQTQSLLLKFILTQPSLCNFIPPEQLFNKELNILPVTFKHYMNPYLNLTSTQVGRAVLNLILQVNQTLVAVVAQSLFLLNSEFLEIKLDVLMPFLRFAQDEQGCQILLTVLKSTSKALATLDLDALFIPVFAEWKSCVTSLYKELKAVACGAEVLDFIFAGRPDIEAKVIAFEGPGFFTQSKKVGALIAQAQRSSSLTNDDDDNDAFVDAPKPPN